MVYSLLYIVGIQKKSNESFYCFILNVNAIPSEKVGIMR